MNIKHQLQEQLKTVLQDLGLAVSAVDLTHPQVSSQGDYATNVALTLAKQAGKNPRELAKEIISNFKFPISNFQYIERLEVAGPGFINIFLKQDYFLRKLQEMLSEDNKISPTTSFSGKKVMIEFTDPNPFKEFHIGHLYSNTVGEAISRLLEALGAEVKRVNYQGDVGLHVAKAVWGMQQKLKTENLELQKIEGKSIQERAKWLGEAYALGATAYEGQKEAKEEITEINKLLYEISGESSSSSDRPMDESREVNSEEFSTSSNNKNQIKELYSIGRQWSLDYFERIYERLGTKFAFYYFESEAGPVGLELVKEYLKKGVFEESDGAIIFPGEKYGLHNRVFINSLGLPTYEAKELGLAPTKYKDFPYDISLIITGNEINEYFRVLLKALEQIAPDLAKKTKHLSHGMVRLPEGKMSSRTGNVLTGEWLLDEARRRLAQTYPDMDSSTLDMVSVASVKWALLRSGMGKDVSFSFEQSISLEGDSGPYIQYTYARTRSVLEKANDSGQALPAGRQARMTSFWGAQATPESLKLEAEELQLLKLLARFEEVAQEAAERYSPHLLTTYLFDLAQAFNLFYQKHSILNPSSNPDILVSDEGAHPESGENRSWTSQDDERNIRNFRLGLTAATGNVLKQGLHFLGIQTPEKM